MVRGRFFSRRFAVGGAGGRERRVRVRRPDLRPAVILLDNLMLTGEEFLEERKADSRLVEVPVVLLSAWGHSASGEPLEVDEYVPKPYDPERLLSLARRFLRH